MWWLVFSSSFDNEKESAEINRIRLVQLNGETSTEKTGINCLEKAFQYLCDEGACVVWVWDMNLFGMFCEHYALSRGLKNFNDAEKKGTYGGRKQVTEPCYNCLYSGEHGILDFRITLARSRLSKRNFRGGKVGAMHTVEYRGLSSFFPDDDLDAVCKEYGVGGGDPLDNGKILLQNFLDNMAMLVGENVFSLKYLRRVYTIGGAAKRLYLRIKYPSGSISDYHKDHEADEDVEDYFRKRRLLLGGMCFFPVKNKERAIAGELRKYDVNGLYSITAEECGEISFPVEATFNEFVRDRRENATYIIVVKNFIAYRLPDMPNAFNDPIDGVVDGDVIQIEHEIAMFRELWETLKEYYVFEEFDVINVFRCDLKKDSAIVKYDEHFLQLKEEATLEGDIVKRRLAKMFLNVLIGKFTERSNFYKIEARYNEERDMVEFARGEFVDNWTQKHFDYIRGAYIYTMARVRVMRDIAKVCRLKDGDASKHHFYTDTDSIVTDCEMPKEMISGTKGGLYKIEREYDFFGVFGKKVYYGHSKTHGHELVAAGIPKGLVAHEIREAYGENLSPEEYWKILLSGASYDVMETVRVRGGGATRPIPTRICDIDLTDFI